MSDQPTPRTDAAEFSATVEKPSSGDYELRVVDSKVARALERKCAKQAEEMEVLRVQLAACMTAAALNTRTTSNDRINRDNPYWSQAYADVCAAVDREIAHREKVEQQAEEIARLREDQKRLDFLDVEALCVGIQCPVIALVVKQGYVRNSSDWANTVGSAREAIDATLAALSSAPVAPKET